MDMEKSTASLRPPGALVVLILCAGFLLSVAIGHSDSLAAKTVRILVPQATAALPFLLMERETAVEGIAVKVDVFLNHPQALALLLRGEADLLLSGTSTGWESRLDGSPIVMIDTGVWGVSFLVGKDESIRSFADLRGKTIALPFPGSPLDFQTRAILAREKIDPDRDLGIRYGPFAQSVQKLLGGQLDAAALPEPLATTVIRKNGLTRLVGYADAWARVSGGDGQSPQVSLFSTEAFANKHRELIVALVEAWRAASRKVANDTGQSSARFASALSTDPDILEEATRNTLLSVPPIAENRMRVLTYYKEVAKYLSGGERQLDARFFFLP
jgi:ABC-type nitrate/sulfonate/bicarbonate transport system substrate-binding protein